MKVLLTGAFGNIGRGTLEELLERGHQVRCFDVPTRANLKVARCLCSGRSVRTGRSWRTGIEVQWGDLCNPKDLEEAVEGAEVVIHLAFMIPKLSVTGVGSEDQPDWAREVNVGGTRNLLAAMSRRGSGRIIFASSLHVYGITRDEPAPRRVTDPTRPMDNYALHKVECEALVRESGLQWSVFRLAAALPFSLKLDGAMFEIALNNRMEYVHHRDVGAALAKAVSCPAIWGKVLHIGGGPCCQYTYRQIVHKIMAAVGVGMLPESAFSLKPFSTDWIETAESQRLLDYQHRTLDDYVRELRARLGVLRLLAIAFRPAARALLLRRSPHYATRRLSGQKQAVAGKLALVTCGSTSFGEAVARKLAQEGMRVVLLERSAERLASAVFQIRQEGGEVEVVEADLTSGTKARELFEALRGRFGPPEVLVNHADLVWLDAREQPDPAETWKRVEEDLLGTMRLSDLVTEEMKKNRSGRLIYLEPALKLFPVRPSPLLYGVRALFRTFFRKLARELRGTPVRVGLVKVGIPTTDLLRIRRLLALVNRRPSSRHRYGVEVRPETLAERVWILLIRPQRVVYVPQLMALFSWLESYAGWIVELIRQRLGPKTAGTSS